MSEIKAKRCKLCGGVPKYVYYAIPKEDNPSMWYESADGFEEPYMLFKSIECSDCGATFVGMTMTIDEALNAWNEQKILVRYGEEKVANVEAEGDGE